VHNFNPLLNDPLLVNSSDGRKNVGGAWVIVKLSGQAISFLSWKISRCGFQSAEHGTPRLSYRFGARDLANNMILQYAVVVTLALPSDMFCSSGIRQLSEVWTCLLETQRSLGDEVYKAVSICLWCQCWCALQQGSLADNCPLLKLGEAFGLCLDLPSVGRVL